MFIESIGPLGQISESESTESGGVEPELTVISAVPGISTFFLLVLLIGPGFYLNISLTASKPRNRSQYSL